MTSSTQQDVELQVVTLFQTGTRGEDQRFDILDPWHQPLLATLQWCLANPLVGWVAPCISFRRHTWQHRKQVFAISWTDLADPHTVPVLIIETVAGTRQREWHVAYLPVNLKLADLQFWTHHDGAFEVMDRWRLAHPTLPDVLVFGVGTQLWLRFGGMRDPQPTHGLHLLQRTTRRMVQRASLDGLLQVDSVIPPAEPSDSDYSGDNSDPSSGQRGLPDPLLEFEVHCLDDGYACSTSTAPSLSFRPHLERLSLAQDYSEDNVDLSAGSWVHGESSTTCVPTDDAISTTDSHSLLPLLHGPHVPLDYLRITWISALVRVARPVLDSLIMAPLWPGLMMMSDCDLFLSFWQTWRNLGALMHLCTITASSLIYIPLLR